MMKLDTTKRQDWQGFAQILEVMSSIEGIEHSTPDEVRETFEPICQLPADGEKTMSMEEVVFWAGVASGIEVWEQMEAGKIDPQTAEKMLVFSSIFGHSTKNAIVDLALNDIEPQTACERWPKL